MLTCAAYSGWSMKTTGAAVSSLPSSRAVALAATRWDWEAWSLVTRSLAIRAVWAVWAPRSLVVCSLTLSRRTWP